ncbi:hypothetical protein DFJ74DRAFT_734274 [Hyaloraphidium curvatum]|nr:hypothetical protein DFJ74DRAFT_734274 [Hyaloraphidium curvatum]
MRSLLSAVILVGLAAHARGEVDPRTLVLRCAVGGDRSAALSALHGAAAAARADVWRVGASDFDVRVAPHDAPEWRAAFACADWIGDVSPLLAAASRVASLLPPPPAAHAAQHAIGRRPRPLKHDFDSYLDYPSMVALLESYAAENPAIARFVPSMGVPTWEHRNISCLVIRSAAEAATRAAAVREGRNQVLFTGGMHAREWIAPATVLFITHRILEEHGKPGSAVRALLEEEGVEWTLCPCVNPDGYTYAHKGSGQRLWRKNRRSNGLGSYGVDLNRNFPVHWGETGSSSLPFSEIYQGPSAGSEPETQAIMSFSRSLPNLTASIDFHSFGQLILRSWGFTERPSRNERILKKLGDGMGHHLPGYTSEQSSALYPTSGSVDDWLSAELGIAGFTIELRDKGDKGFLLPPSEIKTVGAEAFEAAMFFTKFVLMHEIPPNGE